MSEIVSKNKKANVFLPGATIGIFGSGQLGRMFTIAAKQMGYRVQVFSPDHDSPTGQVADEEIVASYSDIAAVTQFAERCDVLTLEFENLPVESLRIAAEFAPLHPGADVLKTTQHRLREKTFLHQSGFPVAPFHAVRSLADLEAATSDFFPGVLKTTAWGYDGKGQVLIRDKTQLASVWESLETEEAIWEQLIDFEFEMSVLVARNVHGDQVAYQPIRNEHANHILDVSVSPAGMSDRLIEEAQQIATEVMQKLGAIGLICLEFFVTRDGRLIINEIAPRPHNSGHLTIEAHVTSQFEQQVRAVCGLPLGSTEQLRPAAMANLLGDFWQPDSTGKTTEPNWATVLATLNLKLHLYGKTGAKIGRKMGHLTAVADSPNAAVESVVAARKV